MAEKIYFSSDGYQIEGLLERLSPEHGVVITHPHPLYGGNMHNSVVETISRAYEEKGFTTLRFNFRGVGASQGKYDHGRGERTDVKAAITYLKELGIMNADLAGYSFGTWVSAGIGSEYDSVRRMVMVSPPMAFLDFSGIEPAYSLQLIISGQEDEIAPVETIRKWLSGKEDRVRMEVIAGADHFFSGHLEELAFILLSHL